jgi:nucleoside-diphosphate-sugar epimerase
MKILVTGAEGFAGKNFVERFKDKFEIKPIADAIWVKECNALVNFASIIEAPYSLEYPMQVFEANVKKTMEVLEQARKYDLHFIQPSSNLVYGNPIYTPIDENHPFYPQSPYAATRVCQETLALSYYRAYGLPVTILRLSNGYGPYGKGVINVFIENARQGKPLVLKGGDQTRTFTHIYDFCDAIILALNKKKSVGDIFNISGPDTVNLKQLVSIIRGHFPKMVVESQDFDKGDITSTNFKITYEKAKKMLGYEPQYNLAKGIEQVINFEDKN